MNKPQETIVNMKPHHRTALRRAQVVLTVIATCSAARASQDISDGTFADSNWNFTLGGEIGGTWWLPLPTGSGAAGRAAQGSGYRSIMLAQNSLGSVIYGFSFLTGTVCEPSSQDPIKSVSFAMDSAILSSAPQAFGFALRQNGQVFVALNADGGIPFATSGWTRSSFGPLQAADFTAFATGGSLHPDFSADGKPIEFGFFAASSGTPNWITWGGYDNFSVSIDGGTLRSTSSFVAWTKGSEQGLTTGVNDGPMDDPDHDGGSNLLEFVLGDSPMVSSRTMLPKLTRTNDTWVFEYDRSLLARPPETTQFVEFGSDLSNLSQLMIPATSTSNVTITPGSASDHVRDVLSNLGARGFARLKVTH